MTRAERPMSRAKAGWSIGLSATAGVLLLMGGGFQFFQGLAAIVKDDFFVVTPNYSYAIDVTVWGWIHLVMGLFVVVTGVALLMGATWARITGIVLAIFSAVANFMFIPYYPLWAIVLIALDVAIIWALTMYDRAID